MRKHSELHPCGSFRLVTGSSCVMCAWPFAALNSIRNRLPRVARLALCCVAMAMEPPKRRRIWAKRPPLPHEELQAPAAQPALAAEAAPAGHRRRQVFCPGRGPERPCCFAADGSGRAATAKGTRDGRCSFCHRDNMDTALGTARGRKIVARLLRQWRLMAPNIFEAAFNQSVLAEIDGATRESLRAQVSDLSPCGRSCLQSGAPLSPALRLKNSVNTKTEWSRIELMCRRSSFQARHGRSDTPTINGEHQ